MLAARTYKKIDSHRLPADTPILRYQEVRPDTVAMNAPATDVMTDLSQVPVISIEAEAGIDEALKLMIHARVRMLVVFNSEGDLVGLITSRDIVGEKPVDFVSRHRIARDQVRVADIMTPRGQVDVLHMAEVTRARVGDIIETLREQGRQHALAIEKTPTGEWALRGIFSTTHIGRRLGISVEASGAVQSFAELEAVLAG
ncbi:MAG: CBS domain-containing protein [Proteobacteria bacterium]|nr:MAG: CBS domain-containing protein [Pseudomonadota bacterium]QKK11767.1 MAG: CBS domain-containing protein [Pseudomonadota bacterium]